jgi:hypothetical protein
MGDSDYVVRLAVVIGLTVVGALAVLGIILAQALGHEPQGNLATIAGTCCGALGVLLVNGRGGGSQPPRVVTLP